MTGYEIAWFLEDLLYDLTHPSTANILWLLIRLVIVFVVSMTLYSIGRRLIEDAWRSVVKPLLLLVWRLLTAPIRIPFRMVRRWIVRPLVFRRQRREAEAAKRQRYEAEQAKLRQAAEEERQRLAEIERVLEEL